MWTVSVYSALGVAILLACQGSFLGSAAHTSGRREVKPFGPTPPGRSFVKTSPSFGGQFLHTGGTVSTTAQDCLEVALRTVKSHGDLQDEDLLVKDVYRSHHNGVTHVYLRQLHKGVEVINADMNVNLDAACSVMSVGSSFRSQLSEAPVHRETPSPHVSPSWLGNLWDNMGALGEMVLGVERWFTGLDYWPGHRQGQVTFAALRPTQSEAAQALISPRDALLSLLRHIGDELPEDHEVHMEQVNSLVGEPLMMLANVPQALDKQVPARMRYLLNEEGLLEKVWDLEVEMDENWLHAHVSAHSGKVLSLVDWVADAQYNVYPLGINDPLDGNRTLLSDPADKKASPFGWHDQGNGKTFTDTRGNNAYTQENADGGYKWESNYRPDGGKKLVFDFPVDLAKEPETYLDGAITNLFYWNNIYHDLTYQYGFTEEAGNFQENNFERGGKGGDAVIANAQDGSGYNNANFATPPDGRHGKMRMYVWNGIHPKRDGDLESGIIIHEYTHGVSTRLTGGPANSGCLGWGEAGGMGEGWGDFVATVLRMTPTTTNTAVFSMGSYANAGAGIRKYNYSTNMTINPSTYKTMDSPGYWGVHAKGEVWAAMLYEVYWALVDKHGFTPDWFSASPDFGNTLALQLVFDGMKLQPCRPNFLDARDAIIQADQALTGGQNKCLLWKAFAKRGLGEDASIRGDTPWGGGIRTDSFRAPDECVSMPLMPEV
ncbi:hypothetical protein IWQ62_000348 [Dispira parvispora]|uniref:Extracellular metalloproteinase n=1 Tax=Dispira parvispora TaxID=1520584 RepID=A0A9W8E652_9FUNG|nr:hypothetical protein IWQ62_000348 [Dispira parvispora]